MRCLFRDVEQNSKACEDCRYNCKYNKNRKETKKERLAILEEITAGDY